MERSEQPYGLRSGKGEIGLIHRGVKAAVLFMAGLMVLMGGCSSAESTGTDTTAAQTAGSAGNIEQTEAEQQDVSAGREYTVTEGTEEYRGGYTG